QAGLAHVVDQLVGVEVVVLAEDVLDHVPLLLGEALRAWAAGEVLPELVFRGLRNGHGWQRQRHGLVSSGMCGPGFGESRIILDYYTLPRCVAHLSRPHSTSPGPPGGRRDSPAGRSVGLSAVNVLQKAVQRLLPFLLRLVNARGDLRPHAIDEIPPDLFPLSLLRGQRGQVPGPVRPPSEGDMCRGRGLQETSHALSHHGCSLPCRAPAVRVPAASRILSSWVFENQPIGAELTGSPAPTLTGLRVVTAPPDPPGPARTRSRCPGKGERSLRGP